MIRCYFVCLLVFRVNEQPEKPRAQSSAQSKNESSGIVVRAKCSQQAMSIVYTYLSHFIMVSGQASPFAYLYLLHFRAV